MGRGRSELQKAALRHVPTSGYLNRAALLVEVFGWRTKRRHGAQLWSQNFRPRLIGEAKYRSGHASLSRAAPAGRERLAGQGAPPHYRRGP
jgi:hypothetical protein